MPQELHKYPDAFLNYIMCMLFCCTYSIAQEQTKLDGVIPKITHYDRTDFEADGQFWTMTEDDDGILYFGNNDGVIIYDGERWQKLTLPNHSTVRSLVKDNNNVIHVGGYNEIGVIKKDENGNYFYASQVDELQLETDNLENFWQAHNFKDAIIYRTFRELIVVSDNTTTHIKANSNFLYSGTVNGHLYVQDQGTGIFEYDPSSSNLQLLFKADNLSSSIIAFLPTKVKEELVILTKNGELYLANRATKKITFIKSLFKKEQQELILTAVFFKDHYLLGTLSSKILKINQNFELETTDISFSKLNNSAILSIYPQIDKDRIWVLMNNGIDFVEFNSPISQLFDSSSISDMHIFEGYLYLATNTGVYYSLFDIDTYSTNDLNFKKIPDLEGQAWSIQQLNGEILVGHDKGLFRLDNFRPKRIGTIHGIWKVLKIKGYDNTFLAATYSGIYPLSYNESWTIGNKIKGFEESSRDILQIDSSTNFWICHGYKGVYKLKLNPELTRVFAVEHYTDQNGLQSSFNVNVTAFDKDIIFTTNTGVYTFDNKNTLFTPHDSLNSILNPKLNTRKLLQQSDKVWFVQDDEVGYFKKNEENKLHKNLFLDLKGYLNRGMESILPLDNHHVLIGATNGVFLFDLSKRNLSSAKTILRNVSYKEKGQISSSIALKNTEQLPTNIEMLRFEFAAPRLTPSSQKEFQYMLDGIDSNWSSWSTNAFKEYTHPAPGSYTFKVRSRNYLGQTAEEASLSFSIPQPWYSTRLAYLLYILSFIVALFITRRLVNKKIDRERQKEKLAAAKSKKLLELEIEQLKLEKDKARIKKHKEQLEQDNLTKSKELANYTMLLVKKKEIFTDTFNALKDFKNSLKTQAARKRLQEVLFNLNQHRMGEEYLNVFDVHFEKVHENFFKKLKEIDPGISKRELRLCAFVKMNLTNKEIAPLLNISIRGVETARYRVRKKLDVNDENFNSFLENLSKSAA